MKILITGNMGYVGPLVLRRLRESHPGAELIGYDTGYFAHCLTGPSRFPESRADIQYFGDIEGYPERSCGEWMRIVHLCAISNDPMGALFEDVTLDDQSSSQYRSRSRKRSGLGSRSLYLRQVAVCMDLQKAVHVEKRMRSIP